MDPFVLKKVVSSFVLPYTMTLLALGVGIVLQAAGRARRAGSILALGGLILLLAQSTPWLVNGLADRLTSGFEPVLDASALPPDVRWVVVLSGATAPDMGVPVSSRNAGDTLHRVVDGVLLARGLPGARLLLAGGGLPGDGLADGGQGDSVMRQLVVALGFPAERIVTETAGRDTGEQARNIAKLVGRDKVALVTSLRHMARSMELMRACGVEAVPAPAAFPIKGGGPGMASFLPSPGAAAFSAVLAHEATGMVWERLKALAGSGGR